MITATAFTQNLKNEGFRLFLLKETTYLLCKASAIYLLRRKYRFKITFNTPSHVVKHCKAIMIV